MDASKLTIEEKTNIAKFNISNDEQDQLEKGARGEGISIAVIIFIIILVLTIVYNTKLKINNLFLLILLWVGPPILIGIITTKLSYHLMYSNLVKKKIKQIENGEIKKK
jgi:hypothetical protein